MNDFKIGDYIIVEDLSAFLNNPLNDFLKNNVGKIENFLQQVDDNIKIFMISYYNLPIITTNLMYFKENEIRLATEEEIKNQPIKDDVQKYNL